MAGPDYSGAIAAFRDTSATDICRLLTATVAPMGARDVVVYLADFEQEVLQPLLFGEDPVAQAWVRADGSGEHGVSEDGGFLEQEIATTMAGRCFQTGEPLTTVRPDGIRVWVPLVEHSDRTGVLALTVAEAGEEVVACCVELGLFAGLLVAGAARSSDVFTLRRQGRSMTAAAGMQWDLIPPATLRSPQVVSSGLLKPAYQVAGDAFDHALNGDWLHVGLFDGMGHDMPSTLMTTQAVGVYRHARRARLPLPEIYRSVDTEIGAQWAGEAFVTGLLLRLQLSTGQLKWANAGHPSPLLLRDRHVIGELDGPRYLPFGLGDICEHTARTHLQPGDSLLLFTDGVVESRPSAGEDLGVARLADLWEREALPGRAAEEVTRRLAQAVTDHQGGKLHDDATLVLVQWLGPPR